MATELAFEVRAVFPRDPAFARATAATRRAACAALVPLVQRAYHHQLEAGIGADGAGLTGLAMSTRLRRRSARARRADPNAPPLIPAHALSRTNSLLRGRVLDSLAGVEMYWLTDRTTGLNWGQVIAWHRAGSKRYPPRDVMGLAPQFHPEVQAGIDHWWSLRRKEAGALATPVPAYVPKVPAHAVAKAPKQVVQFGLQGQTYTVGATSGPVSVATLNAAIRAGTFSGFRRLGPPPTPRITPPELPKLPKHPKIPGLETNQQLAAEARAKAEAERKAREAAEAKARREAKARAKAEEEKRRKVEKRRQREEAAAREREAHLSPEAVTLRREIADLGSQGERDDAIRSWIAGRAAAPEPYQAHGMTHAEPMRTLEWEGQTFRFADDARMVDRIRFELMSTGFKPMPPALKRATREIVFTGQANEEDARWKVRYNDPSHVSGATAGDGRIVVYRGMGIYAETETHESGHNLAASLWGSTHPDPVSAYGRLIDSSEPPVSDYAKNSPSEDFAEAVQLYVMDRDELRRIAPQRHAVLKRLMEDPSYAG